MEKLKIEAIIRSSGDWCEKYYYVMNRQINKLYTKIDQETIIGYDEGVLSFYHKKACDERWKAFGGREFDLHLTDGTVEHCYGQWWDAMSDSARELYDSKDLCRCFACATKEELKRCYVYCGYECEKKWLEKLKSEYNGKIYDYWEYKELLKGE